MNKRILLLDSTLEILTKLREQGFDVEHGTVGFCDNNRLFPSQLYEKDVFIYDPVLEGDRSQYSFVSTIQDKTPEFSITELSTAISNGGIFFGIIKPLTQFPNMLTDSYSWIPGMPQPMFTKDNIVSIQESEEIKNYFAPLTGIELKKPVGVKLLFLRSPNGYKIFCNQRGDILGVYIKYGGGLVILMPECASSVEAIDIFLHRILPKFSGSDSDKRSMLDFISPAEEKIRKEIELTADAIKIKEGKLDLLRQDLATADRTKIQKIHEDETAVLILNYYDLATRQDDVALFYIYKIIDALENKYGNEKLAQTHISGLSTEWSRIGKLANVSYGDMRHAPKAGEKVKEWSKDEIDECFEAGKKIIHAYLKTLF